MKNFAIQLDNLLASLESIATNGDTPMKKYLLSIEAVSEALTVLELDLVTFAFSTQEEEINFFKNIKPQFDGRLLLYIRLAHLESHSPEATKDRIRFYRAELRKIKRYYRHNNDFYRYVVSGATHLDEFYFLRTPKADSMFFEEYAYNPQFNTRMSFRAAKMRGLRLLTEHIKDQLLELQGTTAAPADSGGLVWQVPKVYLAELIYGLFAMGAFGNADLQRIVKVMTTTFQASFANPYKVFEEIRLRKKNRTAFTDAMRLNLLRRMEQDDEFSL